MHADGIDEIEEALGVALPPPYRELLLALPEQLEGRQKSRVWRRLGNLYLSAEEVIQANSIGFDSDALSGTEWEDEDLDSYLIISGDGCGNYFIVDPDDPDPDVRLLSHDPLGIQDVHPYLSDWCVSVLELLNQSPAPWWKSLLFWRR